jgi:hypothetical protein
MKWLTENTSWFSAHAKIQPNNTKCEWQEVYDDIPNGVEAASLQEKNEWDDWEKMYEMNEVKIQS